MSIFSYIVENWPWLLSSGVALTVLVFTTKLIRHRRFYKDLVSSCPFPRVKTSTYAEQPTPPHSLFWGNLKVMGEATQKFPPQTYIAPVVAEIAKTYSQDGIFYLDLWPFAEPFVFITDPDLALQVQTLPNVTRHRM